MQSPIVKEEVLSSVDCQKIENMKEPRMKFSGNIAFQAGVKKEDEGISCVDSKKELWDVKNPETFQKLCRGNNLAITFTCDLSDEASTAIFSILEKFRAFVTIDEKKPYEKPMSKGMSEKSDRPPKQSFHKDFPAKSPKAYSVKENTEKSVQSKTTHAHGFKPATKPPKN
jgi:hypothetical protein